MPPKKAAAAADPKLSRYGKKDIGSVKTGGAAVAKKDAEPPLSPGGGTAADPFAFFGARRRGPVPEEKYVCWRPLHVFVCKMIFPADEKCFCAVKKGPRKRNPQRRRRGLLRHRRRSKRRNRNLRLRLRLPRRRRKPPKLKRPARQQRRRNRPPRRRNRYAAREEEGETHQRRRGGFADG
jgi:hypothetical protein